MTWKYRYRKQILIGCILAVILITGISFLVFIPQKKTEKKKNNFVLGEKQIEEKTKKKKEIEKIQVDVKGEVLNPGLYELSPNKRVSDAIEEAGGLTEHADVSVINLSRKLTDEMVIIIYSKEEVKDFKKTKEIEKQTIDSCKQKDKDSLNNDACIGTDMKEEIGMININTATLEQLMTLPGIGESKAKEIISYREANGEFKSIEDIKNVTGIGDSVFARLEKNITI